MEKIYKPSRIHTYRDMLKEAILFHHPEYKGDSFFENLSKTNLIKLYCNIKNGTAPLPTENSHVSGSPS